MEGTKTYQTGDKHQMKYPDAPRPPEKQCKIGQRLSIRDKEGRSLLAIWEVTETDENEARGKIVMVFKVKSPTDPRKKGPAGNREVKPL